MFAEKLTRVICPSPSLFGTFTNIILISQDSIFIYSGPHPSCVLLTCCHLRQPMWKEGVVANDSWLYKCTHEKDIVKFFTCLLFYFTCREKERICGPDGFLDSKRYQRSYKISRKPKDSDRANQHISVVDLRQDQHQHSKDYDKRMKVIEVSKNEILCVKSLFWQL